MGVAKESVNLGQRVSWQSKASLYTTHSQSAGGNHRSVIFRAGHSITHHSSVVIRHDESVGHHSDDSVGPFKHETSVCRSQHGTFSDCGRYRQSGLRPEPRLLRQPALEALTNSTRTDSPRRVGRKQLSGERSGGGDDRRRRRRRSAAAAAYERKGRRPTSTRVRVLE
ncbi:hypothetical protein F511_40136 [Dorcoceras hygrometricum]|uniref:Uncharacterized protein n=1 Tax=Dorcoceras hygrometricum TaxID=472368 RepID=A0A2Z7B5M6_9LAMI|nr:hypothetical protein F511_40136 [Dorcoceras hygrometricum]